MCRLYLRFQWIKYKQLCLFQRIINFWFDYKKNRGDLLWWLKNNDYRWSRPSLESTSWKLSQFCGCQLYYLPYTSCYIINVIIIFWTSFSLFVDIIKTMNMKEAHFILSQNILRSKMQKVHFSFLLDTPVVSTALRKGNTLVLRFKKILWFWKIGLNKRGLKCVVYGLNSSKSRCITCC